MFGYGSGQQNSMFLQEHSRLDRFGAGCLLELASIDSKLLNPKLLNP